MLAFWRRSLAGAPPSLMLPTDRPRPARPSFRGVIHAATVGPELTAKLKARAVALGITLPALVLAAFQALLHRMSGQQDVVVGLPVPGRPEARFADTVGYFINTVAVRADLAGNPAFARFAARQEERLAEIRRHQDYPFPLLVERLKPPREGGQSPFFQVFFVLYQGDEERVARLLTGEGGKAVETGGLTLVPIPLPGQGAMFDLSLLMSDAGETLAAAFQYATDLFDAETIARLARDFLALLEAAADDPERAVGDLPSTLGAARIWQLREPAPAVPAADLAESRDRAEARRALLEKNRRTRPRSG
jgi:non-ribosomal peptide synthetase component F